MIDMLTVEQLSEKLNLSTNTIYKMVKKRQIPFVKLGYKVLRFDPIEIDNHIKRHTIKPKT